MGLWALIAQLPYGVLRGLGFGLGTLLWVTAKRRRHIADRNLKACFPDWSDEKRQRIMRKHFTSLGMAFFETGVSWFAPRWRIRRWHHIEGLEHIQQAQANGQGVILLGLHMTTLDIGGAFLGCHCDIGAMYRPNKNPVYDYVQLARRQRYSANTDIIHRNDLRTTVKTLKRGRIVWYAPDQDYGVKRGVFAPFFNVPAATITTTSKLAALSKAAVIPFYQVRLPGSQGYKVVIQPPLSDFPSGDDLADATCINHVFEGFVEQYPEQYLWVHRRFKNRPEGTTPIY